MEKFLNGERFFHDPKNRDFHEFSTFFESFREASRKLLGASWSVPACFRVSQRFSRFFSRFSRFFEIFRDFSRFSRFSRFFENFRFFHKICKYDAKMKGRTHFGKSWKSPPQNWPTPRMAIKKKARFQGASIENFTCGFVQVKEEEFQKSPLEVSLSLMIIIQNLYTQSQRIECDICFTMMLTVPGAPRHFELPSWGV